MANADHPIDVTLPEVVASAQEAELRCALLAASDIEGELQLAGRTLAIRSDDTDAVWAAVLTIDAAPLLRDVLVLRRDGSVISIRKLRDALGSLAGDVPLDFVVAALKSLGDDYCPGVLGVGVTKMCEIMRTYVRTKSATAQSSSSRARHTATPSAIGPLARGLCASTADTGVC